MRYTRSGWPMNKATHYLGGFVMHPEQVATLVRKIEMRFGHTLNTRQDENNLYTLTIVGVLRINRYTEIKAYIDGFVDGTRA